MSRAVYAVLLSIILIQFPMYLGTNDKSWAEIEYSVSETSQSSTVSISLNLENEDFKSKYTVTTFSANANSSKDQQNIIVIRDDDLTSSCYSVSGYGQARAWGMLDHLNSEDNLRGSGLNIIQMSWKEFRNTNLSGHLFITYDQLPDPDSDLTFLSQWIQSGGILFSQGRFFNEIGESSSKKLLGLPDSLSLQFWERKTDGITYNSETTEISEAFGLGFPQSTYGFSSYDLESMDGTNLGKTSTQQDSSAISFIPVGGGGIIHFGGCLWARKWFDDEKRVAYDVINLVQSGLSKSLISSNSRFDESLTSSINIEHSILSRNQKTTLVLERDLTANQNKFLNIFIFNEAPIGHRGEIFQIANPFFLEETLNEIRRPPIGGASASVLGNKLEISIQPQKTGNTQTFVTLSDYPMYGPNSVGIFWDTHSSPICNDRNTIEALFQNFIEGMHKSGTTVNILSDVGELLEFLQDGSDEHLVFATTIIPSQVFDRNNSTLSEWISSGGTLYWIGDIIGGYVSSDTSVPISWDHHENLQWEGEELLFGESLISNPATESIFSEHSEISNGLGLDFSPFSVSPIFNSSNEDSRIFPLGKLNIGEGSTRSSISYVSLGSGGVVVFGGCLGGQNQDSSPTLTSSYISRILLSGIANSKLSEIHDYYSYSSDAERFAVYEFQEIMAQESGYANILIFDDEEVIGQYSFSLD